MGPVEVTVKSDVRESKYPNRPPYIILEIDGQERTYSAENDRCADFFRGQEGQTFTLSAEGTKEDATLGYCGESAAEPEPEPAKRNTANPPARGRKPAAAKPPARNTAPPPARNAAPPQQQQPQRQQQNPPARPGQDAARQGALAAGEEPNPDEILRAKKHAMKVGNAFLVAFAAALQAKDAVRLQFGYELPDAQFQALATTILIQLEKDGMHRFMPTSVLQLRLRTSAPADPKPEPSDNDGANVDPAPAPETAKK